MSYTKEEDGRLNNFAIEPKMYQAEPATQGDRLNYVVLATGSIVLLVAVIAVAVTVSL
ncbi:MAG: photosystem II assembly protein Psb34 [Microcoleaceae cyanobacterium]